MTGPASGTSAEPDARAPLTPLALLAQNMHEECAAAVDPLEIAAALEADGVSDEEAGTRYGCTDVFDLGARLYAMTPRLPPPRGQAEDSADSRAQGGWRARAPHHLLRGVVFGLPGLCYAAVARSVAAPGALTILLFSLLASWGVSQSLSYLAYVRLGRCDRRGAAVVARRGSAGCAAGIIALAAAAAAVLHSGYAALALAAGQSLYLLAATASLIPLAEPTSASARPRSDAEWWLLCALAPGALASAGYLLSGGSGGVPGYVWGCGGVTVAAAVALAAARTGRHTRAGAPPGGTAARIRVTPRDLTASLPHALFGMLAGLLLTFTAVAAATGHGLSGSLAARSATAAAAPLSLSMGVAEWLLFAYRRRGFLLLLQTTSIAAFAAKARRALAASTAGYLAALAALTAAFEWLAGGTQASLNVAGAYVALGGALYLGLVLQSCGVVVAPLCAATAALIAEAAMTWAAPATADASALPVIQLSCHGSLLAVLFAVALTAASRPERHS
jgi:hypothetical protein